MVICQIKQFYSTAASPLSYELVQRLVLKSKFAYESFVVYILGYASGRRIQSDTKYVHVREHHLPIWISAAFLNIVRCRPKACHVAR